MRSLPASRLQRDRASARGDAAVRTDPAGRTDAARPTDLAGRTDRARRTDPASRTGAAARPGRDPGLAALAPGSALLFVALYLALDWVSFIHPMRGLDITPWNPQAAIAVGFLLWQPRAWWLVVLAVATGDATVGAAPLSWPRVVLSSLLVSAGYAATALALGAWLGRRLQVPTRRHFCIFLAIAVAGALLTSALQVAALAAAGTGDPQRTLMAVQRGWIGDMVGLMVALPLLYVLASPQRRAATAAMLRTVEGWAIAATAVAGALLVFGRPAEDQFKLFYILFLPVAWAAARFGITGAAWSAAWVQGLIILAVQSAEYRPLTVAELQVLVAILAATGLLLGSTVEEREEAAARLRESLRLAAAGDMAAALAHELNQPLAALSSYARAAQLLAGRLEAPHQQLADVTGKLVAEAARAGEVVRHLRNFFRHRATALQPCALEPLLAEVLQSQAARAQALRIRLDTLCTDGLPPLWMDRVQVAVVLRNLVANAIEAAQPAAGAGTPSTDADASVSLQARRDGDEVLVSVVDSGPGLAPEDVEGAFETRASAKPGGMGLGLAISRSIVEAHGGRLWAEPGPGGRFHLTLPTGTPAASD